jgi:hypothetical protein
MTKDEALKLALEALENGMKFVWTDPEREAGFVAIDAIKEALAQPAQATSGWSLRYVYFDENGIPLMHREPEERNFCQRCGKRTADLTTIHTCTPPQENT